MPATALAVTEFFLEHACRQGDALCIRKLQALCYYAQAYQLGLRGQPLFDEPILAQDDGPAIQSITDCYGGHGDAPIPAAEMKAAPLDIRIEALLRVVYQLFRAATGYELVLKARGELSALALARNNALSTVAMSAVYCKHFEAPDRLEDEHEASRSYALDLIANDEELRARAKRRRLEIAGVRQTLET